MSTTVVVMSGDASQLLRELQKIEAGERKVEKTIDDVGKAADNASNQVEKIGKAGRYGQTEMDKLLRELRKTGPEGGAQARALEKHFQEAGTHGRRSVKTILDEIKKIDPEAVKASGSVKQVSKGIDRQAIEMVGKYAAGFVSLNTVLGITGEALRRIREEQSKALSSLESVSDSNKRLLQVATSAEDYKKLTSTADQLAMDYGIGRDQARALMFSARSENFEGSAGFIARNAQVLDVQGQATVAGQIPGLFQKEGLSAEQAINMGLVAAAESRLNFEEIARAMPRAAEGGSLAGASSTETFGALSVLAGRFQSGETASDRLKAFASRVGLDEGNADMGRASLQGSGIMDAVAKLQQMSEEQRKDFLGNSQEVNAAYVILVEEQQRINERIAKIANARETTGTDLSPVSQKRAILESDPQLMSLREKNKSENRREIANERKNAEEEARRITRRNQAAAGAKNRGESEIGIALGEMASDQLQAAGFDRLSVTANEALAGGDLALLQRSASSAMDITNNRFGERKVLSAINAGAFALSQRDAAAQPGQMGILSRQEAASFLSEATGNPYSMDQVTPEIQQSVSNRIRAAAAANPGRRDYDVFGQLSARAFGGGAIADAQAILPAVKLQELIDEVKKLNETNAQTARNTAPANNQPNYSGALNRGADAVAMPSF